MALHRPLPPARRRLRRAAAALAALLALGAAGTAQAALTGPDVSSHQHPSGYTIDWSAVHASGAAFAFVKASEGSTYTNPYFAADWAALGANATIRGAYHFARPNAVPGSAVAQAQHFVAVAGTSTDAGDLAPVLDLEVTGGLAPADLTAWAQTWLATVAALTGRTPIIYTYPYFWKTAMAGSAAFTAYPLWIASYSSKQPGQIGGWPTWTFWQYTDAGTVAGVPTKVDVSTFNGTQDQLRAMAGLPATGPVPTTPVPDAASHRPTGRWTSAAAAPGGVRVTAWAADPDSVGAAVPVRVSVDGSVVGTPTAGAARPDLAVSVPALGAGHGLDVTLPLTPGKHQVCLTALGAASTKSKDLGCRTVSVREDPRGSATVTRKGDRIWATGWAVDPQGAGPVTVRLTINGRLIRTFAAQAQTPLPTGSWAGWGPGHGYATTYPVHGKARVCLSLVNQGYGSTTTSCWAR
ncbi:GH25 family lysozyme M1 (1,4-beta-N-acetylmuramidase) [Motilibacter rhizosphaerae]|uniref:GH25 family lysozyme M1 (1,4-beta-N-acetylmuramidase) n=1 Tax=Motilibacter rhizosphaerae TaxID=598652 RepID=A0A4Q7NV29_9ACTN|nr:glycoside hydrolase family 25 protein [Motilibacter rhizosphaerae]RZS91005.1 GH25 family lysozyme M1 (1,4-beta-N-acetylmuramidase) [Motilibacter rhizosphaerae]